MFTCKICKEKYKSLEGLYSHIEEDHEEMIPRDMTVEQYYYYMKTGKSHGNCVICKAATKWNESTHKYHRFCSNPKCKEKYKEEFRKRMIGKHGKVHLLNDPEQQKKMLANRSISGTYKWSNNPQVEIPYTGSYELDFLKNMDLFFNWDPEDIIMPSPHTYYYEYEGQKKFYIPDVFIPSLGLEIEIKDGGDNPNNHHKIQAVDKVKEKKKDDVMTSQKSFHYIKLINKNYANLIVFLHEIKEDFEKYGDINKAPRRFYIEDAHRKITNKDVATNGVELLQESTNFDDIEMEEISESTISFSFIKDLISTKRMRYNEGEYFKNYDEFKYHYIKFINSCSTLQELEIIKKDVQNLKSFINHNKGLGKQSYVDMDMVLDLEKWVMYDVTYSIENRQNKLRRSNRFVGNESNDIEVIVLFDRSKNRSGKFFTMLDKDSKIIFNRKYILDRYTNKLSTINDDYMLDNECMVYNIKSHTLDIDSINNRQGLPKMLTRMFNANTTENKDFISDVIKTVSGKCPDNITFVYSGTYKKYIEGGVK